MGNALRGDTRNQREEMEFLWRLLNASPVAEWQFPSIRCHTKQPGNSKSYRVDRFLLKSFAGKRFPGQWHNSHRLFTGRNDWRNEL